MLKWLIDGNIYDCEVKYVNDTRTAGNPAQSYCFKAMKYCSACDNHGNCMLTAPCTYKQTYMADHTEKEGE